MPTVTQRAKVKLGHKQIRLPAFVHFTANIFDKRDVARATRRFEQFHSGFVGSTITLFRIALHAGADKIFPRVHSGTGFRHYVVNRKRGFGCAAVLALVVVASKDIFPRQLYFFHRYVDVAAETNNAGARKDIPNGTHFPFFIGDDNFCFHQKQQGHCFFDIADAYRLVTLIQHQYAPAKRIRRLLR